MQLSLEGIEKTVVRERWLSPLSLSLQRGAVTVLLGATQAGKTSLMRIMAGLDQPTRGQVRVDGRDVTGVPVREREVAMVYQQFINYPSMTVAQNIASPLQLQGRLERAAIAAHVQALAERLHIAPFLQRLPAELSGGQQQRVAMARALAKGAPLLLLDEPLVNLDYKLREELREELVGLFASGESTVVYATTEPTEALLLGGHTAVLDAGELLQYGPTAEVFHRPASVRVARAFSDPPMNLLAGQVLPDGVALPGGAQLALRLPQAPGTAVTIGIRASALRVQPRAGDLVLAGQVELSEISGSDSFVHVATASGELVAQLTGVHDFALGSRIALHLASEQAYAFDAQGALLVAPRQAG
ncbi:MAG TPA: ABC transporter ATP-binding protein [Pseudorhodoferax sp.]|nr:ABC transporter ATP-binding protein [Pseudorhodoferax sp.]